MTLLETAPTEPRPKLRRDPLRTVGRAVRVVIAPLAGILVAAVLIQAGGFQPLPTIVVGLEYSLGSVEAIGRTIAWGLPLYVATLGVVIAYRTGIFTVGAEGQIYLGALVGAVSGAYIGGLFPSLHQAVCVILAAVAAGAVSAGFGWLATHWNVDVILSTLLGNYILVALCIFLANGPFNDPNAEAPGATVAILPSAEFPLVLARTQLTWAIIPVAGICLAVWWFLERSVIGYRWRMIGESPGFAVASGIDVARWRILAMAASGALCGIAGSLLVLSTQGRFASEIAIGLGWIAVMLALMGRSRPVLAILWVTVYSVMQAASRRIEQVAEVPSDIAVLVICTILVAAAAAPGAVALAETAWRRRHGTA